MVFKYFLFSPLFGEDSHFDWYSSDGLKPPTRCKLLPKGPLTHSKVCGSHLLSKKKNTAKSLKIESLHVMFLDLQNLARFWTILTWDCLWNRDKSMLFANWKVNARATEARWGEICEPLTRCVFLGQQQWWVFFLKTWKKTTSMSRDQFTLVGCYLRNYTTHLYGCGSKM